MKHTNNMSGNYSQADLEAVDSPELTDEELQTAQPFAAVFPKLAKRGRPKADKTKKAISIRLDDDVIVALKANGKGWQTRTNQILRDALDL